MINVNQVASQLARMPDQALQQYAAMNKDDPYTLSMALSESNRRKEIRAGAQAQGGEQPKVVDQIIQGMGPEQAPPQPQPAQAGRQLPEEQGIGALPAPNIQGMADGGIVGYADRGAVKAEDPLAQYESMIRAEAERQGIDPEVAMRLFRQESGGQKDVVSAKGATGLGQLMPAAAKEMGLKPEERTDPAKNIPASIGYFKKQLDRFGTYDKAAAAYNWGPGNVEKHIAESIKKNRDFRVGLPKETAGYLTAVVPAASARADAGLPTLTKAPVVPKGDASVPGSPADIAYQAQLKAERGPEKSYLRQRGEELLGAPETIASLATGAISPATGAVRAGIDRLLGGKMSVEEGAERMTYAPRLDVSKESLSQAQRALEDFKIPPFIPGLATSRSRPRAPEAIRAAEAAAETAAQKAAKVEPLRLEPPKPAPKPGVTPESAALGEQAKLQRRQQALVQDRQAAMEAQRQAGRAGSEANTQRTLDLIDRRYDAEQAARAGIASKVLPAAEVGANVEPTVSYAPNVAGFDRSRGAGATYEENFVGTGTPTPFAPTTEVPIEERSRVEPKAAKKGFGLSDEDMLMLGLNLMAGKSQHALSNLGEAGIATLGAKREREKLAADKEQRDIMGEYYKKLSGTLGTSAEERMIAQIMKEENIPYAAAIERISGAKYAPRAETTERDFMKQYEALAKNPVFIIDNPDAAAWVQNQMRMRGLTTSGSSNLASGARFVGFEGQQ
jgi:hypothetical protein